MKYLKMTILVLILIIAGFLIIKTVPQRNNTQDTTQNNQFRIVSTSPNPLDGATLLPNSSIEITLSKPTSVSQFKYHFDPEIPNNIEPQNDPTFKIIFTKPLELGQGYTLFIDEGTVSKDGEKIDRTYTYHFSTIKYSGV